MNIAKNRCFILAALLCLSANTQAATDLEAYSFFNWFTQPGVIPKGCLVRAPAINDIPTEQVFYDQTFSVNDTSFQTAVVRIRAWRIGCHDPNRSALAVNFQRISGYEFITYPFAQIEVPRSGEQFAAPLTISGLTSLGDIWGLATRPMVEQDVFELEGFTLLVDPAFLVVTAEDYNSAFNLLLTYENGVVNIPVPSYDPLLDPTQTPEPVFHGRYAGQWIVEGLPRSGMVLQFGERGRGNLPFVFVVWFTYLNGEPFWITGNRTFVNGTELASNEISIEMLELSGGEFVTQPGTYSPNDVSVNGIGTMTIRAVNCNQIEADLDFSDGGYGQESLTFSRLIRLSGFDCDQTQ